MKVKQFLVLFLIFQATKKLIKLADFEDDDLDMNDSDDASDASDFDEDLDPDKIEVPGMIFSLFTSI